MISLHNSEKYKHINSNRKRQVWTGVYVSRICFEKSKDACLSIQEIIRKSKDTDFKVITIFSLTNCLVYTAMYISAVVVIICWGDSIQILLSNNLLFSLSIKFFVG